MISSLDTYVYKTFEKVLPEILKDKNLMKQTLINIDDEAGTKFIEMFCGDNPKSEINLSYSFPESKKDFNATLVISSGKSVKVNSSLGGVEATFTSEEYGIERELAHIEEYESDLSLLRITVDNAIGEILGIDKLSFSESLDEPHIKDNHILFNKQGNEHLLNKNNDSSSEEEPPIDLIVTYTAIDPTKDVKGAKIGYTSRETVQVTPLSNNLDIARCLDIVIHTLLIIMQQGMGEQSTYLLQDFTIGEMQQLANEKDPTQVVYGRPIDIQYTISNSINNYFKTRITEIILANRVE